MLANRPPETAPSSPFEIIFDHYDREDERRRESLFSLGNGLIHVRASAPEAMGAESYPGVYRAGCYERLEGEIEGEAVAIDSLVRLPNWLPLSFRPQGETEWFSLAAVSLLSYRQTLNLKRGIVSRDLVFRDAAGRTTRLVEERLVSMQRPHLAALHWTLAPQDWSGTVEIRSALDGGVANDMVAAGDGFDPRALTPGHFSCPRPDLMLIETETRRSQVRIAMALRTRVTDAGGSGLDPGPAREAGEQIARHFVCDLSPGRAVSVEKVAATFTSRDHAISRPAEAAVGALEEAPEFEKLRAEQARQWEHLWGRCHLEVEGEDLSRAVNLHAFHLLQTASPHSARLDAGLPSRGWQEAYHGQIFWDETLSLPLLNLHFPTVSRSLLLYRYERLDAARRAARAAGRRGAMFPWRSGNAGGEVTPTFQHNPLSGRWMRDHTHLQRHVGAAIAHHVWQYFIATRDIEFLGNYGAELLIEIARFWASAATLDPATGRYSIRGVMGPDEFHTGYPGASSPGLDNSAYTNAMAAWTLARACEVLHHLPGCQSSALVVRLGLDDEELRQFDEISRGLTIPFHGDGTIAQFEGFGDLAPFDLGAFEKQYPGQRVDWVLEADGRDINAYGVLKQADVAMLLYLFSPEDVIALFERMGYRLSPDQLRRTVNYYLDRTAHDSSLSDLVYAGALAKLAPKTSWRLYREALHPDEKNGHSGAAEGIHLGAMAATLDILQRLYLGIRAKEDALVIDPAPPPDLGRVTVRLLYRSNSVTVAFVPERLTVSADPANHASVDISHRGTVRALAPGKTLAFALPEAGRSRNEFDGADFLHSTATEKTMSETENRSGGENQPGKDAILPTPVTEDGIVPASPENQGDRHPQDEKAPRKDAPLDDRDAKYIGETPVEPGP